MSSRCVAFQGLISDKRIDGLTFVPKCQGLSKKVGSFLSFELISNKKSTFVLVSGFFLGVVFSQLFKYYSKGRFLILRCLLTRENLKSYFEHCTFKDHNF